ncbi:MAG: MFS transporter, partial [Chloroflexota bacterium]|nr:MFS transporter [Chloroflexota bacterium]
EAIPAFRFFLRLWLGQVASLTGSAMTRFALAIHIWDITGEATPVVLVGVFAALPALLLGVFAGVMVDRWQRKWILVISDLGSGFATLLLLLFLLAGDLSAWHIYAAVIIGGICNLFQSLAFSTSISLLVDKAKYNRANAMMSLAEYTALIGAPVLAGILFPHVGLAGIFMIDVVTFLLAVSITGMTPIPQPERTAAQEDDEQRNLWRDLQVGVRYLFARRSFVWLLAVIFLFNAVESLGYPLLAPLILARSGGDSAVLGTVQAMMGIGGIIGGLVISVWSGPKRKVQALLLGILGIGLLGNALMGLAQVLLVWLIAGFFLEAFIPMAVSANRALWQVKVAPSLQGRVFATTGVITGLAEPVSSVMGGVLADQVFEPAMRTDGWLTPVFSGLVGVGEGAGMALLFVFSGVTLGLVALVSFLTPSLYRMEMLIPDHEQVEARTS